MAERFMVIALAGQQWVSGRKRSTVQDRTYYVSGVRWADGGGLKLEKLTTTSDRGKAARFRESTAAVLVEQIGSTRLDGFGLVPTVEAA